MASHWRCRHEHEHRSTEEEYRRRRLARGTGPAADVCAGHSRVGHTRAACPVGALTVAAPHLTAPARPGPPTPALRFFAEQDRRRRHVEGYLRRLASLAAAAGSSAPHSAEPCDSGYFRTSADFHHEATRASGGRSSRSANYYEAAFAVEAWIRVYRPLAYHAIQSGNVPRADELLCPIWPALPRRPQARSPTEQQSARRHRADADSTVDHEAQSSFAR